VQRYEKDIIQTNNLANKDKIQGNNSSEVDKIQGNNQLCVFQESPFQKIWWAFQFFLCSGG
jgi:hypothetical protein